MHTALRLLAASVLALVASTGCNTVPRNDAGLDPDAAAVCMAVTGGLGERALYSTFTSDIEYRLLSRAPDASGLYGSNIAAGTFADPYAQNGVGTYTRLAIVADDLTYATRGMAGIERTLTVVDPNTGLLRRTSPAAPAPDSIDGLRATAELYGDLCTGLIAVAQTRNTRPSWGLSPRTAQYLILAGTMADALFQRQADLSVADRLDPDRLLATARALASCGAFGQRPTVRLTALRFVQQALTLQRADGAFTDGTRSDTDIQGRALAFGYDLLTLGDAGFCNTLPPALGRGASWLAGRVDAVGRVNSTGNGRSCTGGEVVLGRPRVLDVFTAFRGLAQQAIIMGDGPALTASRNLARWLRTGEGSNPCFP